LPVRVVPGCRGRCLAIRDVGTWWALADLEIEADSVAKALSRAYGSPRSSAQSSPAASPATVLASAPVRPTAPKPSLPPADFEPEEAAAGQTTLAFPPPNVVELATEAEIAEASVAVDAESESHADSDNGVSDGRATALGQPTAIQPGQRVAAMFDFAGESAHELSFSAVSSWGCALTGTRTPPAVPHGLTAGRNAAGGEGGCRLGLWHLAGASGSCGPSRGGLVPAFLCLRARGSPRRSSAGADWRWGHLAGSSSRELSFSPRSCTLGTCSSARDGCRGRHRSRP
jgi:hypothetical protein